MLLQCKEAYSAVWVGGVMHVIYRMFVFFGLSQYLIRILPPSFLAHWLNVIGLFILRQCFFRPPPSTETWVSGTSQKLPICHTVSIYVYWRMTMRMRFHACFLFDVVMYMSGWWRGWCWRVLEIDCTRWFIGRCVFLCVWKLGGSLVKVLAR